MTIFRFTYTPLAFEIKDNRIIQYHQQSPEIDTILDPKLQELDGLENFNQENLRELLAELEKYFNGLTDEEKKDDKFFALERFIANLDFHIQLKFVNKSSTEDSESSLGIGFPDNQEISFVYESVVGGFTYAEPVVVNGGFSYVTSGKIPLLANADDNQLIQIAHFLVKPQVQAAQKLADLVNTSLNLRDTLPDVISRLNNILSRTRPTRNVGKIDFIANSVKKLERDIYQIYSVEVPNIETALKNCDFDYLSKLPNWEIVPSWLEFCRELKETGQKMEGSGKSYVTLDEWEEIYHKRELSKSLRKQIDKGFKLEWPVVDKLMPALSKQNKTEKTPPSEQPKVCHLHPFKELPPQNKFSKIAKPKPLSLEAALTDKKFSTEKRIDIIKMPGTHRFGVKGDKNPILLCLKNDHIPYEDKVKIVEKLIEKGAKVGGDFDAITKILRQIDQIQEPLKTDSLSSIIEKAKIKESKPRSVVTKARTSKTDEKAPLRR